MPWAVAKVRKQASDPSSISPNELQADVSKDEAEAEFDELTLLTNVMLLFVFFVVGQVVKVWWEYGGGRRKWESGTWMM